MMRDEIYLKESYEPDVRRCKKVIAPLTSVEHRLGQFDAINEWQNEEEASAKFLNTKSYKNFIQDDYIILIGRTGTGKTAILKKIQYEIENQSNRELNFKYVINIYFKPYLVELIKLKEIDNTTSSLYDLAQNIEMLLNLEVMREVYMNTDFVNRNYPSSKSIKKYFVDNNINSKLDVFSQIISEMKSVYEGTVAEKALGTLSVLDKLRKKYINAEYNGIMADIYAFLSNQRMLILIDSMDRYNIREPEVVLITQTLVEVAFNSYYNQLKNKNILVKIALPAELSTMFIYRLPEKQQQNSVTIEWKYRELITMIAIRWFYYCKFKSNNMLLNNLTIGIKLEDFYTDYSLAKCFLLKILPEKCVTSISLNFNTLAYCIKHTQKKPRQLMKIFNVFIDKIVNSNNVNYFFNNPERISFCIHTTQSDIISDTVNMYNDVANARILEICSDILYKKNFLITKNDLMKSIKSVINNSNYKIDKDFKMDAEKCFEILKECGMIGKIYSERYIDKNNSYFENDKIVRIVVSLFEYQVKEKLIFDNSDFCVLHPMCYEYFENEIDYNTLIYPSPVGDDEDLGDIPSYLRDFLIDY